MVEPNILIALFVTLILCVAAYISGYIISCIDLCHKNDAIQVGVVELFFSRIAMGALALVVLYAVVRTAGTTILLGACLPLLLGAVYAMRQRGEGRRRRFALRPFLSPLPVATAFVIMALALTAVSFFQTSSLTGDVYDMNRDYAFYASAANNLSQYGVETLYPDFAAPELMTPMLYRYGELWLTALVGMGGMMSLYYALILVVFPFFGATALIGIGALCERYIGTKGWRTWVGCVIAGVVTVVYFKMIIMEGWSVDVGPINFTSLLIQRFYPLMIALTFALLTSGWRKIAALCIGGLLNLAAIAPILAGATGYLVVCGLRKRQRTIDFWLSVATVCVTTFFVVGFYAFTAVPNPYLKESYSILHAFRLAMWQFGWGSLASYAVLPLMEIVINILPCAVLLLKFRRTDRTLFKALAVENGCLFYVILASVFGFAAIWYLRDSIQIYYSLAYPLFIIANSLLLIFALFRGSVAARSVAILFIGLNIAFAHGTNSVEKLAKDKSFYNRIAAELQTDATEHRFAWVEFKELRSAPDLFLRDANYRKPLHDISRFENGYTPVRLDVYDIEYNLSDVADRQVVASIDNSSFYRYTTKHRLQKDISEAQNRYIRDNKIRYVIVPRGLDWFAGRGFRVRRVIESPSESYSFYILEL